MKKITCEIRFKCRNNMSYHYSSKVSMFFLLVIVISSLVTSSYSSVADVVCPQPKDFLPCECIADDESNESLIKLDCGSKNLNDTKASDILDAFLSNADVSPLLSVDLQQNQLTAVPIQLRLFEKLVRVNLNQNHIRTVTAGSFVFVPQNHQEDRSRMDVYLDENQISSIEPDTFQGGKYFISLRGNRLTRFESDVFQPLLEIMVTDEEVSNNPMLDLFENPIECESDPCHLDWLINTHRHLMNTSHVVCSNGTSLWELDGNSLGNCSADISNPSSKSSDEEFVPEKKEESSNLVPPNTITYFEEKSIKEIAVTMVPTIAMTPELEYYSSTVCPVAEDISPCKCERSRGGDSTVSLFCEGLNLDDVKASRILESFLLTPDVSPLGMAVFSKNKLTRIPNQLRLFNRLRSVDFSRNLISSIEPGAIVIDDSVDDTFVSLNGNLLTRLEANVFHSLLKQINVFESGLRAFVSIRQNPIDCESESICHLSWFVKENRKSMNFIREGRCSNGTRLDRLDPNAFGNCDNMN